MECKVYSVRDSCADTFGKMFLFINDELAKRAFTGSVTGGDSAMADFPADFTLYRVGTWNDEAGIVAGYDPVRICTGFEMVTASRVVDAAQMELLEKEVSNEK